jgi:hypothetical protein
MFALSFCTFETSLLRLVGGSLTVAAAALLLQRHAWPLLIGNVKVSRRHNLGGGSQA